MFARNADERLLESRRINPQDPRSPLEQALRIALYDEWQAMATYEAVIARFGPVRPFVNIVQAEANHANAIIHQMQHHGFRLPVNDWAGKVRLPATLKECCAAGVAGEIDNVAMYDDFLSYPLPPDVVRLFQRLKNASGNNHLPAFQRCLSGMGQNRHEGQDMRQGAAQGFRQTGFGQQGQMRQGAGQGKGPGKSSGEGPDKGPGRGHGMGHGMGQGANGQGRRMRHGQQGGGSCDGGACGGGEGARGHQAGAQQAQMGQPFVSPAVATTARKGVGTGLVLAGAALLGVGALVRMARNRQTKA
ncbi:MAG: hypothetical protein AB7E29_11835 [Xanthobacter sp.]